MPWHFWENKSRLTGVPKRPSVKKHEICSDPITANLRTKILDFREFDSSIILILRGGIPRPIGNFPESLSQAILVGIILVGRLGVVPTPFVPFRIVLLLVVVLLLLLLSIIL